MTLIADQLHYQLSSAIKEYLHRIDAVYKRTGSFLETETKTGCSTNITTASLSATDLEFIQFSEKEYRAREEMVTESRSKRTKITVGDMYWNALISIRDGIIDENAAIKNLHIEMKTSSSQTQFSTALNKLLELKYVTLSKKGELALTRKGVNILTKLDVQQSNIEDSVKNKQSITVNHCEVDLTETDQADVDCRSGGLKLMLDCRGESSYAKLLSPDIAQRTSIAKLSRGDCLIVKDNHPVALVERKTISDLSASLYDGRIQRQLSSSATCPTFLLVEDPQLLLVHENQLFRAVLDEIDKGNVSSVIQSTGVKHTARIYEYLFNNASGPSQCQSICCTLDTDRSNPLPMTDISVSDDWRYFIKNILCNYPPSTVEAVVRAYPNYKSLAVEAPSTVQQRLLAMGMPRSAARHIVELLSY